MTVRMTNPATQRYRELPPPRALTDRLLCLWVRQVSADADHACSVLPDGCVDIVYIGDEAPIIAGPATRTMISHLAAGTTVIGARFRPGRAVDSLGVKASDLRDCNVPLAELSGPLASRFGNPVIDAATTAGRLSRLAAALQEYHAGNPPADPLTRLCTDWLVHHPAGRLRDLARLACIGERRLHRRFCAAIGYSPKTFQRIMRLQRVRWLYSRPHATELSQAELAQLAGFADQSHMCREAAALAGVTPRGLNRGDAAELALSDLFNTPADA